MRHRMRLAKAVLRWCHENEWIDPMPTSPKLPVPVKRPKHYEADVIKAAWETLGHAKDILTFLVETAARPSEGCRLEWIMVNLRNRTCELDKHKKRDAGGVRILHLTPLAVQAIESQPKQSNYVFLRLFSQKRTGETGLTVRLARFCSTEVLSGRTQAPGAPSPRRRPYLVAGAAWRRRSGRGPPGRYGAEAEASSGLTPVVRGAVASAYETAVPRCAFRRRTRSLLRY